MKDMVEFIFASALFINALLFIPQAFKVYKEKTSLGISLFTFFGFLTTQFAIVLHGLFVKDYLLAFGYLLSMMTCATVIFFAILYRDKQKKFSDSISAYEILEQLPGHIYWKDKEGKMLGCNTNNWRDFGLRSLSDYIGKTDFDIFPREQAEKLYAIDSKVIQSGKLEIIEEILTKSDSSKALYLSYKVPLKNRYNKIIGILGTSIDITHARNQELARLDFLENIIALMPGTVYWMDKNGVYLGCNDNEARSIGLKSRKDIIGKRNIDIPGFLVPEALDPVNKQVMESGKPLLLEEPAILPDGSTATFLSNKVPLYNENGEVTGMLGISFDITERKRMELELQEIQQKLDGMTLVSSTIAHELRTPLASFGVAVDNIKKVIPDLTNAYRWARGNNAPVRDIDLSYLNDIEATLTSMDREIRSAFTFIDISLVNTNPALEAGKPEVFSINKIIEESLCRFPFNGDQRELIHWTVNQEAFLVKGDKELLIHVFFNLLKNALYYIAKAHKGIIEIWVEPDKSKNKLYFKDTGTGMGPDVLPHIFDRFFTRTHHGAGVGLTFCKMVMESLRGNINCESVEGEYTLFVLEFPGKIA